MRRILFAGLLGCCILAAAGCSSLKQGARGFLGVSTREIEEARNEAIVRIVDCEYPRCYKTVEERLFAIGSYIYARRSDLIAVYISSSDTTPAGVFFREIDTGKTEIAISSPAQDTREYLAEQVFSAF
ncbi:hypothetical protein ACFL1D_02060 [Candidatus Omnitrophota bacterium]